MNKITTEKNEYKLIKNYKEGFNKDIFLEKYTDFFDDYDYIVGDFAYDKLRLKGFCNKDNKLFNKINDKNNMDNYIKEDCAYECKYFILEKIK